MSATPTTIPVDPAELGFEEAMIELEGIVRRLEEGKGRLDDAILAYERGTALRRRCEAVLREAQAKIERIARTGDGETTAEPIRVE